MKKIGKRLGALLLALVMVLSLVPMTALAARVNDDEIAIEAPESGSEAATATLPKVEGGNAELMALAELTPIDGTSLIPLDDMTPSGPNPYTGEGLANLKDETEGTHYGSWDSFTNESDRYVQIALPNAVWLSGLHWMNRGAKNGAVTKYDILVSSDGSHWSSIADNRAGEAWVKTENTWNTVVFSYPVFAQYVKVIGVETQSNYISCAELRLATPATAPSTASTTITVKTGTNTVIPDATVVVGGQAATTNGDGVATVTLISGQEYTATVTAANYASATAEVTGGTTTEVALEPLHRTISGTVTTDGSTPLADAKVELVQNNTAKSFVTSVASAATDANGVYTLNVNSVAAGEYCVRVSKDGHGAKLSGAVNVAATELTESHENTNVQLPAVDTSTAKFVYDMTDAVGKRPALGFNNDAPEGCKPTVSWENDKMKLVFPARNTAADKDGTSNARMNRLVKLVGTGVKNGTIEFDATREGTGAGRFALALRLSDQNHWVYIGQENNNTTWFHERWNGESNHNDSSFWSSTVQGPSFGNGDTRHFKITINSAVEGEGDAAAEKIRVSLDIDGVTLFTNALVGNNNGTGPMNAADVGFICGNNDGTGIPSNITIDNLYIFRDDPTFAVTLGGTPALTAKVSDSSGDKDLTNDQAAAGDVIKVTCPSPADGMTLGAVTVTETNPAGGSEARTVTATMVGENDNTYFTFTMPDYAVTVTGELKNSFNATLTITGNARVGSPIDMATIPSEATVSYQWYRIDANNNVVTISNATGATYTPVADDQGKTLKVVVTGTGEYAGIKAMTIPNIGPADTQITGVTIARSTIKMIKNGNGTDSNTSDPANTVVSGNTTTLTATVSPDNATGLADGTVQWTVDDNTVVQLGAATRADNVFSMPITAVKNGTATVTATATSADGTTQSDSVTITVVTKVEKVTIKNGAKTVASTDSTVTGEGLILHANTDLADHPNSAALAVEVYPEDATTPAFNWARADGQDTGLLTINGDAADGSRTFTVNDTSDAKKVGTKDFKLTVTSTDVGPASTKELTFNVTVRRYLQNPISIGLGGKTAPTIGQQMEADVSQLVVGIDQTTSESAKANLTYQWYALDSADAEIAENATPIHSGTGTAGKTYTPAAADAAQLVGKRIAVRVTATPTDSFFYEGAVTAKTTNAVVKMDGPDAPVLSPTKPATGGAENSGYITITNYASYADGTAFQIKAGDAGEWNDAAVTSEGKIENLTAGKYFVKVKETAAQLESAVSETTIAVADAREYNITATQPAEGATISVTDKAVENAEVTITLNVAEGWKVDAVTVTDADNGSVTANREGTTNVWKFSMPAKDVTVTATVSKIQLKIKHTLTNITCGLGALDQEHEHTVDWGAVTTITFTPADGYTLPTATGVGGLTVKLLNDDGTESDELYSARHTLTYNPDPENPGKYILGFGSNGLRSSISITAAATLKSYTVSFAEMNGLNRPQATQSVNHGGTYTYTLTPMANYALPENITVTMAGNASPAYTYNKTTGAIEIQNVTGAVTITANGVRQYDQVTGVSIEDPTSLEVDSILSSSVQPAGAVVSYQWMSSATENGTYADIAGANTQTYTLKAADVGKYIKLKVTGDNDHNYDGTQTSAAVGPVVAKTIPTTGIVIQEKGEDVTQRAAVVGDPDFTLTAVVSPDNATDKAVTWAIWQVNSDQPDTSGVLQLTPGANGTVSVKILKAGNVRIHATASGGQTCNCTVNVERAPSNVIVATADNVSVPHDGQPHSITVTVTQPTSGYTIEYRTAESAEWSETNPTFTDVGTYTVYYQIVATDYETKTGSATVTITDGTVTPTPHTVTFTLNGAALAEVTGGTASGNVVTVADNGTLTFKLTVADTAKEVKSVKVDGAAITPVEGVYTISAITADKNVVVEVGDKGVTPPAVNTAALEAAITAATQAKAGVRTYETEMDPAEVSRGTKYTTDAAMGTLNTAITAAEAALTAETQAEVDLAVETLNAAVTAFNATVKTGTKASSSSTSSRPSTSTETTTNPDGSKTTTVTDNRTGTVTATTEKPDGTVEVVETKKDGTVTETVTTPEGAKTEKITTPDKDVTLTVTDAEGEELAKVELPAVIPTPETRFDDVPEGHWADKAIHNAAALELIEGVGDNKFGIHSTMTRGALATVLHRLSQGKTDYETAFQDVAQGKYYTEGVAWAAKAGVVKGFNADIFAPDQIITREQLAVMLARYAKLVGLDTKADAKVLETFADGENTGSWAVDGVAWCVENGILQGKGGSALDPTANVSRAEAAVMLDRFIGLMK